MCVFADPLPTDQAGYSATMLDPWVVIPLFLSPPPLFSLSSFCSLYFFHIFMCISFVGIEWDRLIIDRLLGK